MRPLHFVFALPLTFAFCAVHKPASTAPPETHPLRIGDLVMLERASDPVASPDGTRVVFSRRKTDLAADKGRTHLWVMNADGGGLRQLTSHAISDSSPRWLSNDTVAFLSARDGGTTQVWTIGVDGGEARQLTSLPVDVQSLRVAPDGKALALGVEVYLDCADLACSAGRDKEREAKKSTGVVFDSLPVRHWDTWRVPGKRQHVVVWRLDGSPPIDVMKGLDTDCPTRPFGDDADYAFSPDGREIALSFKAPMGSREAWSTNEDIWLVPADGSAAPKNLTPDSPGRDSHPSFSPDGKTLAWTSMKRPGYEADRYRVVVSERPFTNARLVADGWDRSADDLTWSRSGDRLFAVADDLGHRSLFAIDARGGAVHTLLGTQHTAAFVETNKGIVALRDSLRGPADFWFVPARGGEPRRITQLNEEAMSHVRLGEGEAFSFAGANGDTVHAWLVKPVDFDAKKRYPLAFLVHGGPQGSFGDSWGYRWNPQTYAGAGYAVVMIDFHGSTGYGQAFTDAIRGDWGGAPFEDLMKGLDASLAKYSFLDGDRACALGASYGGFMMNYLAGKTDRFKCFVTHDGILDNRKMYFDTEELWFPEWEFGGTPWEKPEGFSKHDPIDLVKNWKTPTLVVHGGKDYRIPDSQGLGVFTALQRRGVPSKLLYFPDENHWVLRPNNSVLWHETVLAWLDGWIGPKANNSPKSPLRDRKSSSASPSRARASSSFESGDAKPRRKLDGSPKKTPGTARTPLFASPASSGARVSTPRASRTNPKREDGCGGTHESRAWWRARNASMRARFPAWSSSLRFSSVSIAPSARAPYAPTDGGNIPARWRVAPAPRTASSGEERTNPARAQPSPKHFVSELVVTTFGPSVRAVLRAPASSA